MVSGGYREFVPGQRLVMTWVYEGPMAPGEKMESMLMVGFRKDGPNAKISMHHEGLTNPRYLETIRQGAWTKALDGLDALLANRPSE